MICNVSHSLNFSSSNSHKSLGSNEKTTIITADINVDCTVLKAQNFLFDNEDILRSGVIFGVTSLSFYDPNLDLFDKRQEKNYPTSTAIRLKYRCKSSQKSSKCDRTKREWKKKGWIEYKKI